MSAPGISDPNRGLSHSLPRLVSTKRNGPYSVQVLDGKYRLKYRGHRSRWETSDERFVRRLQFDVDWPDEVEIRGQTLRLPPIRTYLAEEITLKLPADGTIARPAEVELAWSPLPDAKRYRVNLMYTTESPSPATNYFLTVTTDSPRLRLADLSDFERSQVRDNLKPGRTAGWRVDAFDAAGRQIGVTLSENRFLVAENPDNP